MERDINDHQRRDSSRGPRGWVDRDVDDHQRRDSSRGRSGWAEHDDDDHQRCDSSRGRSGLWERDDDHQRRDSKKSRDHCFDPRVQEEHISIGVLKRARTDIPREKYCEIKNEGNYNQYRNGYDSDDDRVRFSKSSKKF